MNFCIPSLPKGRNNYNFRSPPNQIGICCGFRLNMQKIIRPNPLYKFINTLKNRIQFMCLHLID